MANVLIVDDSKLSRRMLTSILEGIGHEVVGEAVNGEEGLRMYKELHPDLVTMDITMPEMDGLKCLREIMEYDDEAKVIMITAAGQSKNMCEAIKEGAKEFICKPYEVEQVINSIREILK